MFHLFLVTRLFCALTVTCHRPVLRSISHFLQACSMLHLSFAQACSLLHLSLVTVLFYAPCVTCHRPVICSICHLHRLVLCSICHLSQFRSMLHLSLVTGLSYAPSVTCLQACLMLHFSFRCYQHPYLSFLLTMTANVTPCRTYQTFGQSAAWGQNRRLKMDIAGYSESQLPLYQLHGFTKSR